MRQEFWVLFDPVRKVFYMDSWIGITEDMLMAEHYESKEKAEEWLSYYEKPVEWVVKKVTMILEK